MPTQKILVDAVEAAEMLGLSERGFYKLLKRTPDLAAAARVVLSARATRYNVAALLAFVESLGPSALQPEPARLIRGREARRRWLAGTAEAAVR
jgi:hypothetical protein